MARGVTLAGAWTFPISAPPMAIADRPPTPDPPPQSRQEASRFLVARRLLDARRLARLPRQLWGLARDPRVPWTAKAVLALLALYLANPIDLIPDFLPVIGHLDDVVVAAGLLALAARLVPADVWRQHVTGDA